jgi:REP element-mobilizing transposase RayT
MVGAQFIAPGIYGVMNHAPTLGTQAMPSNLHHRRSIRLPGYDYAQTGAYFVTICTQNRECLLGEVVDGEMVLNDAGRMVQSVWDGLPGRFPTVELDQFIVMPNHLHGIIVLVGAQFIAPTAGRQNQGVINHAPTLGEIIRAFKAVAARQIRLAGFPEFRWQRNYYEHIIRDEDSLKRIQEYITTNPLRWQCDQENPWRTGVDDFDRWLTTFKPHATRKMEAI